MPSNTPRTKPCPDCGEAMGINRGVCPKCGHMTGWFKIRLYVGGAFVLVAFLGLMFMAYLLITMPAP